MGGSMELKTTLSKKNKSEALQNMGKVQANINAFSLEIPAASRETVKKDKGGGGFLAGLLPGGRSQQKTVSANQLGLHAEFESAKTSKSSKDENSYNIVWNGGDTKTQVGTYYVEFILIFLDVLCTVYSWSRGDVHFSSVPNSWINAMKKCLLG